MKKKNRKKIENNNKPESIEKDTQKPNEREQQKTIDIFKIDNLNVRENEWK